MPPRVRFMVTLSCGHIADAPPVVGLHDVMRCPRCDVKAIVVGIGGTGR